MVRVSSHKGTAGSGLRRRLGTVGLVGALVAGLALAAPAGVSAAPAVAPLATAAPGATPIAAAAAATVKIIPATTVVSYGKSLAVTVTAAGQNGGSVTLKVGSKLVGTKPVSAGKATFTVPGTVPVGRHTLSATFSGGGSAVKAIDVVKVTPRYAIALATATVRAGVATRVNVALSAGGPVVTGKVKILVNGVARAAASLSGGRAVMTIPGLPAGVHTVTGVYQGEGGFNSARSPALRLTSRGASTTTVTLTSTRVAYGSSFPVTVTVKGPLGAAAGRVDLLYGGSVLGAKMLSGGRATWTAPAGRAPARYTLTARYAGAGTALPSVTNRPSTWSRPAPAWRHRWPLPASRAAPRAPSGSPSAAGAPRRPAPTGSWWTGRP